MHLRMLEEDIIKLCLREINIYDIHQLGIYTIKHLDKAISTNDDRLDETEKRIIIIKCIRVLTIMSKLYMWSFLFVTLLYPERLTKYVLPRQRPRRYILLANYANPPKKILSERNGFKTVLLYIR